MTILPNPKILTFRIEVPHLAPTEGIQKCIGFSRWHHHWNSVRLGIKNNTGKIELWNYSYIKGKHYQDKIETFKVGKMLFVKLKWTNRSVSVHVSDGISTYSSAIPCNIKLLPCFGYLLNPYFEQDGVDAKGEDMEINIWDVVVDGRRVGW